jgi:hypothetical protein
MIEADARANEARSEAILGRGAEIDGPGQPYKKVPVPAPGPEERVYPAALPAQLGRLWRSNWATELAGHTCA